MKHNYSKSHCNRSMETLKCWRTCSTFPGSSLHARRCRCEYRSSCGKPRQEAHQRSGCPAWQPVPPRLPRSWPQLRSHCLFLLSPRLPPECLNSPPTPTGKRQRGCEESILGVGVHNFSWVIWILLHVILQSLILNKSATGSTLLFLDTCKTWFLHNCQNGGNFLEEAVKLCLCILRNEG